MGELGVLPDPAGPDDEPSVDAERAAEDGVPGTDLDRGRFAGHPGAVERGLPLDHLAVRRDGLAGPDDEAHPDPQRGDREPVLTVAVLEDGDLLRPKAGERPQRARRQPLGPGLEQPPDEQEDHDAGGDVEVQRAARL